MVMDVDERIRRSRPTMCLSGRVSPESIFILEKAEMKCLMINRENDAMTVQTHRLAFACSAGILSFSVAIMILSMAVYLRFG